MESFSDGYRFFQNNISAMDGALLGNQYIENINSEINNLISDMNSFNGYNTNVGALKGDIAEFWHSGTFNINAKVSGSNSQTYVDRSHGFGSIDIKSNFGKNFGLKYYENGIKSAKQQAKSVFERYKEYQAKGGKNSLEQFLKNRGYTNEDVLNDSIYNGQVRIIPKDQLEIATEWLKKKIKEESVKRPDQVARYKETLLMLKTKIEDGKGIESIELTKEEAEMLARLAREGKISEDVLKKLGISTESLVTYEYVLKQALRSGMTAATISMVLKIAPEIYKALDFLIKNGEVDVEQFKKIGFAALSGGAEGFLRGSVSSGITTACKAGLWGEALKSIDPTIIGAVTVITMNTMKNSLKVVKGDMGTTEVVEQLVKDMYITACSMISGGISQSFIEIPVLGYMIGSLLGSVVGAITYEVGYKSAVSFCVDTGFTMFGLVEQDYCLPDEVFDELGIQMFKIDEFKFDEFQFDEFEFDEFKFEEFKYETFKLTPLKRGVLGINKVGYIM